MTGGENMQHGQSEDRKRRCILEFRDGSGFARIDRGYYPPKVCRCVDPLDANRFSTAQDARRAIGGIFKQRPEDYYVRTLKVDVIDA